MGVHLQLLGQNLEEEEGKVGGMLLLHVASVARFTLTAASCKTLRST